MKLSLSMQPLCHKIMWASTFLAIRPQVVYAQQADASDDTVVSHIIDHLADDYAWHIATFQGQHITLPLPMILYKPGDGLCIFLSSRLVDKHHNAVVYKGYKRVGRRIEAVDGTPIYNFSITKVAASLFLSLVLLTLLFFALSRQYRKKGPSDGVHY